MQCKRCVWHCLGSFHIFRNTLLNATSKERRLGADRLQKINDCMDQYPHDTVGVADRVAALAG